MRYKEMDFARGIATLLIVVGHVITQVDPQYHNTALSVWGGYCIAFIFMFSFSYQGLSARKTCF